MSAVLCDVFHKSILALIQKEKSYYETTLGVDIRECSLK